MADTGKIATVGFGAGAIKYVVLEGFLSSAGVVVACLATFGFGTANTHKIPMLGFVGGGSTPVSGAYCIFGGSILTSTPGDGWL